MGRTAAAGKAGGWYGMNFFEPPIYCRQQFLLVALQTFQPPHEPVGFIGESIGAIDSLERGVAFKNIKADAPLQFAQANWAQMQWTAISLD